MIKRRKYHRAVNRNVSELKKLHLGIKTLDPKPNAVQREAEVSTKFRAITTRRSMISGKGRRRKVRAAIPPPHLYKYVAAQTRRQHKRGETSTSAQRESEDRPCHRHHRRLEDPIRKTRDFVLQKIRSVVGRTSGEGEAKPAFKPRSLWPYRFLILLGAHNYGSNWHSHNNTFKISFFPFYIYIIDRRYCTYRRHHHAY